MSEAQAQQQTYESAAARVEEIIRRLDSGEASLNETLALVSEGKTLIEYCAAELEAVGGALQELRLDELVARLEGEATRPVGGAATADGEAARPTGPTSVAAGETARPSRPTADDEANS
jgi:exodeoxyribonuclease VII small subunit